MQTQLNISAGEVDVMAELAAIDPHLDATLVAQTARLTELGPRSCISDARRVKRWLHLNRHNELALVKLVLLVTADTVRRNVTLHFSSLHDVRTLWNVAKPMRDSTSVGDTPAAWRNNRSTVMRNVKSTRARASKRS